MSNNNNNKKSSFNPLRFCYSLIVMYLIITFVVSVIPPEMFDVGSRGNTSLSSSSIYQFCKNIEDMILTSFFAIISFFR